MARAGTDDYAELCQAIDAEKRARCDRHRLVIAALQARPRRPQPLNLLAQGDSWFDYPLPGLVVPSDVIAQLRRLPRPRPTVLNFAHRGDSTGTLLGTRRRRELVEALCQPAYGRFDAMLFSGGGNDLAGDAFRLWLHDAAGRRVDQGLQMQRVDAMLAVVRAGYEDLLQIRRCLAGAQQALPVFAHDYDDAVPDGSAPPCAGPWLRPGLLDRGWPDLDQGRALVRQLLDRFSAMLAELEADPANNFVLVRTRGTLQPGDWANELHPNPRGFVRIAERFVDALRVRFPGRI